MPKAGQKTSGLCTHLLISHFRFLPLFPGRLLSSRLETSDTFATPAVPTAASETPAAEAAPVVGATAGAESTGGAGGDAPAAVGAIPAAELASGDVMKPTLTPQAGDVDTSLANMTSNLTMGSPAAPQVAPPSWGAPMPTPMGVPPFMGTHPGYSMKCVGSPMMPLVRPGFPVTGAPMSPGVTQSPRKPPPPRNALDDLNIKDFM
ncbi:uncharacterized protein snap91b [Stigmatopora nigra]